ncbi:MAG: M20 family metallopeptidase [Chloroflexi bacterium]|nr:MAG: M20 family metallopeptidase [Chloroflexota bacterium]
MPAYSQNYLPRLQAYQDELLERLELLVNIDSGTGQVAGINHIMTYLERWLGDLGFTVTLHDSASFGQNLVARLKGKGEVRLLLVGHVDTVYSAGAVAAQPFEVRDGLAYGPGVIDMKSGVLMGMYALRVLLETGFEEFGELCFVFNNDEETGNCSTGRYRAGAGVLSFFRGCDEGAQRGR